MNFTELMKNGWGTTDEAPKLHPTLSNVDSMIQNELGKIPTQIPTQIPVTRSSFSFESFKQKRKQKTQLVTKLSPGAKRMMDTWAMQNDLGSTSI